MFPLSFGSPVCPEQEGDGHAHVSEGRTPRGILGGAQPRQPSQRLRQKVWSHRHTRCLGCTRAVPVTGANTGRRRPILVCHRTEASSGTHLRPAVTPGARRTRLEARYSPAPFKLQHQPGSRSRGTIALTLLVTFLHHGLSPFKHHLPDGAEAAFSQEVFGAQVSQLLLGEQCNVVLPQDTKLPLHGLGLLSG
ncbi:hypothetical protein GWK47_052029 [Chionoecetes opilio]|uniref:Uncharacterized protein n=1 Tax=Chionoecetes opilio TaxID=41210 RepID=A0A8J5CQB9_CHIOP|nr:hypothetical protein GWK47_052029 [Chionoecetes opilio]